MKFIYALNETDKEELKAKGYRELFTCNIGESKAYAFENIPHKIAKFSAEDKKKFLFTNLAHFNKGGNL